MFLKELELVNFRNYKNLRVNFPCQKTIFIGKNAQGKTNILEAIYYLATLSSFRASNDSELITWDEGFSRIHSGICKNDTNITLDVLINPPKHKTLKVNSLKKTSFSEFLGNLLVVNFGTSDLLLLRGSPNDRRKWLDDAISQLYPGYKDRLHKYNKIRTQRNNLLKDFKGNINLSKSQIDSLSVWDESLSIAGSNVIHLRQKYIKEIHKIAKIKHNFISYNEESLQIEYNSTITGDFNPEISDVMSPEFIVELFTEILQKKKTEEIIRAQTLIGPHRDDISFYINSINAKSFASQGQQRTIVLSLKLAELEFIKSITGETPILLLDDVLAELDSIRQNFLLNSIPEDTQTIITTVDISNFKKEYIEDVTVYNVSSGTIGEWNE